MSSILLSLEILHISFDVKTDHNNCRYLDMLRTLDIDIDLDRYRFIIFVSFDWIYIVLSYSFKLFALAAAAKQLRFVICLVLWFYFVLCSVKTCIYLQQGNRGSPNEVVIMTVHDLGCDRKYSADLLVIWWFVDIAQHFLEILLELLGPKYSLLPRSDQIQSHSQSSGISWCASAKPDSFE